MRPGVTALAPAPVATALEPVSKPAVEAIADDPPTDLGRSRVRYLWAMRLARIDEVFPLTGPHGGAARRIIAVITEAVDVRAILEPIGEPAIPPRIAQARGPPAWDEDAGDASHGEDDPASQGDPLAQPEPEYDYDPQVAW